MCLPRDAGSVSVIRSVTSGSLRPLGVTEECIGEIVLALSEACTNVVLHATAAHEYEVRLEIEDEDCTVVVVDTASFDVSRLPSGLPADDAEHGRGVAIIRSVMDHTEVVSDHSGGTTVQLRKRLDLDPASPLHRPS